MAAPAKAGSSQRGALLRLLLRHNSAILAAPRPAATVAISSQSIKSILKKTGFHHERPYGYCELAVILSASLFSNLVSSCGASTFRVTHAFYQFLDMFWWRLCCR